jgi:hypothetical protein
MYNPSPMDLSAVKIPDSLLALLEKLAQNTHEVWARARMDEGWSYGPARDDTKKQHPCLVPYSELPEKEKKYDRLTSENVLKMILAAGYSIVKKGQ